MQDLEILFDNADVIRTRLLETSLRQFIDRRVSRNTRLINLRWINSPATANDPFSFHNCCLTVRVDPERLRQALAQRVGGIHCSS